MTNSPLRNLLEQWWSCIDLENKTDKEIITELEELIVELFTFEREEYIGDYGYPEEYVQGFNHMVELVEEKFGIFEDAPQPSSAKSGSYQEMIAKGYEMTTDGFWILKQIPQEEYKMQLKQDFFTGKPYYQLDKVDYQPTPQTPEQIANSLKETMRKAINDGIIPSKGELEKEVENDIKLKNLLKAMDEYFENNKPPTLKERFEEYLQTSDFAKSYHVIANELVDIVKEFLPKEHEENSTGWNKTIKMIGDKLR